MIKILHTADWHLTNRGTVAGRFVVEDGVNLVLRDRIRALAKICDYAEENEVDLIIVAGDVFDNANPENVAIRVAVETIERLAETATVLIVRGNHDGAKGAEAASALAPFGTMMRRFGVYVCERPETLSFLIRNQKVNVFALPYPRRSAIKADNGKMSPEEISGFISRKMEEILSGFHAYVERRAVNVLAGHFTVAGSVYSKEQNVPPFDISVRKEFVQKFDLACLGHLHEPQQFYSGAITRNGFGEETMTPGFKAYEIEAGSEPRETFVEVPARKYLTIDVQEFLQDSVHLNNQNAVAVRIKGRVPRHVYDAAVRKMKLLNLPFLKNAVEIETETASSLADSANVSEEPDIEAAVRMWAAGRDGMAKYLERIIIAAKETEARLREGGQV